MCPVNKEAATRQGRTGWGVAVEGERRWEDLYGPLIFDKAHPLCMGADVGTNNQKGNNVLTGGCVGWGSVFWGKIEFHYHIFFCYRVLDWGPMCIL